MNTIGPSSGSSNSTDFPQEWLRYQIMQSQWFRRIAGVRHLVPEPGAITYRTISGQTHYGVGHHGTSFYDNGTLIIMPAKRPRTEEMDLALQLARSKFGEPLTLQGTENFKGAVLSRAIELGISVANPELQTLQNVLSKQRFPDRVRQATQTDTAQQTTPAAEIQTTPESLRTATEERLRAMYPEGQVRETPIPDEHQANEIRLYRIVKADANGFSVDHADEGSYSLWKRTAGTQNVGEGDWVSVQTGANREVMAITAHQVSTAPPVKEGAAVDDPIQTLTKMDPKVHADKTAAAIKKSVEAQKPPEQKPAAAPAATPADTLWELGCANTDKALALQEAQKADYTALYAGTLSSREFMAHAVNEHGIFVRDMQNNNVYLVPRTALPDPETIELLKAMLLERQADGKLTPKPALSVPLLNAATAPDLHATVAQGGYEQVPAFSDMARSMLASELSAMARQYLCGAMGKDPNTIKEHEFSWPDGNVSRTIAAVNDLGFAVTVPGGKHGAYMLVERDKVPFPSGCNQLEVGQKISFKTISGVKAMSIPKTQLDGMQRSVRMG